MENQNKVNLEELVEQPIQSQMLLKQLQVVLEVRVQNQMLVP
jgi:hypothetical protein